MWTEIYLLIILQFFLLVLMIKKYFKEIMDRYFVYPTVVFTFFYIVAMCKLLTEDNNNKFNSIIIKSNNITSLNKIVWRE